MLRNPALCRTAGQPALLNEVLSLNAQESLAVRRQAHGRLLLNEVLSLNAQESNVVWQKKDGSYLSSMKS